jgi:hypothetical protein
VPNEAGNNKEWRMVRRIIISQVISEGRHAPRTYDRIKDVTPMRIAATAYPTI